MPNHKVLSKDEWLAARKQNLGKEKEFTRLRDQAEHSHRQLGERAARKGSRRRGVSQYALDRCFARLSASVESTITGQSHNSIVRCPLHAGSFKIAIDLKP
jgi:hypothetical protein